MKMAVGGPHVSDRSRRPPGQFATFGGASDRNKAYLGVYYEASQRFGTTLYLVWISERSRVDLAYYTFRSPRGVEMGA